MGLFHSVYTTHTSDIFSDAMAPGVHTGGDELF